MLTKKDQMTKISLFWRIAWFCEYLPYWELLWRSRRMHTHDQELLSAPDMELLVPSQTGTEMRKSRPSGTKLRATSSDREAFYLCMWENSCDFNLHSTCQLRNRTVIHCKISHSIDFRYPLICILKRVPCWNGLWETIGSFQIILSWHLPWNLSGSMHISVW